MNDSSVREVVRSYYTSWASQDRTGVRTLLANDVEFRSAQDQFKDADDFLAACWKYAEGIVGVSFMKELYSQDQAFVILTWKNADGSVFVDAEYLRVESGRVCEILVINNTPSFGKFVG